MVDLTVACVLWRGRQQFRGRPRYSAEWVYRLRSMVARNLSLPHKFVCLSNIDVPGVDVIPLMHDWPGWWSKLELFSGRIEAQRVMYLDLDVLICGSLDELVLDPAPIKFMPPHGQIVGKALSRRPDVIERYQSSCMVWSPPEGRKIYTLFKPHEMSQLVGDQDWIAKVNRDWPTFDKKWFRKIRQCLDGPPPEVKIVLAMPVKNDEASIRYPWVREIWR